MSERNYICGGKKFIYGSYYVALPVDIAGLPETLTVEGVMLTRKSAFHASLLYIEKIVLRHRDLEEKILERFCAFVRENDISFLRYTGEFRLAKRDVRASVVALCEIQNLREFFELLSQELGIDIPPQPTHVTLFTLQPERGIGLNSPAEMERDSTLVQVPAEVKTALGLTV